MDPETRRQLRETGPGEPERPEAHAELANEASDPDPTEWPDPYDRRPDPRDERDEDGEHRAAPGAHSTSEPHPQADPEAYPAGAPERERLEE